MIGLDRLGVFLTVVALLIAVPGPSVLFVVSRGISLGRRAAVSSAIGNEAGLLVQVVLVAFGLGSIVERSLLVFSVIKFAGAMYLVYLGVQAWRHRHRLGTTDEAGPEAAGMARILREGFVVGVSNPKGLLIFTAVLPQFVEPSGGSVTVQILLLGAICVLVALVSDASWGVLAGTARNWLSGSPRRLAWIGGASGVVMVGLGVRLALSDRH
ncbi:LysE family translocator [Kitasatospora sp. NPDC001683]